jgi:hypothetical protein
MLEILGKRDKIVNDSRVLLRWFGLLLAIYCRYNFYKLQLYKYSK